MRTEIIDGGWAHAFFDEVVTYYETAPDYANMADTVLDGHAAGETPWKSRSPSSWRLIRYNPSDRGNNPQLPLNCRRLGNTLPSRRSYQNEQ